MNVDPGIKVEPKLESDELWFKDAIIYQLHVKAFADSNNDGIGDFAGLDQKLDYLGIASTALWLLPFYPSPGRDDGYDISDYRHINPDSGTPQDFRPLHAGDQAPQVAGDYRSHDHMSNRHPWFQRTRRSRTSDARNWYVWSGSRPPFRETRVIFNDTEKSNCTGDPKAQAYYSNRFFSYCWISTTESGVLLAMILGHAALALSRRRRLPFGRHSIPVRARKTNNQISLETHTIIKKIRARLRSDAPGKPRLAEANQWPEDVSAYFGDGDECHMAYHFPPHAADLTWQSPRKIVFPITDILRQTPDIPSNCQWALFLRHHDELTFEMVTNVNAIISGQPMRPPSRPHQSRDQTPFGAFDGQ